MSSVKKELEVARHKLLDLTMRNRLLNFRPSKARTIRVVGEIPREVYDRLVIQEKKMEFRPKSKNQDWKYVLFADDNKSNISTVDIDSNDATIYWEMPEQIKKVGRKHTNRFLQTTLKYEELHKKLKNIHQQSQSVLNEQGYTVLYLALGFLQWEDSTNNSKLKQSPLILVPVELVRTNVVGSFQLSWTGEDIFTNISLQAKLIDEDVLLPEFEMPDEKDGLNQYYQNVAKAIAKKTNWKVLDDINLSFFSFTKFVMYKDLDPMAWPKKKAPNKHPLIKSIFNPNTKICDTEFSEDNVDKKINDQDVYHVMDADPSQIAVIEDVKSGKNMVVEGPPGTGKSQTITNIIAELLAAGKSVLFVSEKMAALEVVKSRLDQVGLGDFCLELHSRKSNKKEVLKELERTVFLSPPKSSSLGTSFKKLENLKMELNGYANALQDPFGCIEQSPFNLYCMKEDALRYFESVGTEMPNVKFFNIEKCSQTDWTETISALSNLSDVLPLVKPVTNHQWKGCKPRIVLPSDEYDIEKLLEKCKISLDNLVAAVDYLCQLSSTNYPHSLKEIQSSISAAMVVALSEPIEKDILLNENWDKVPNTTTALITKVKDFQEQSSAIHFTFMEGVSEEDIESAITNYRELCDKYFIIQFFDSTCIKHPWKENEYHEIASPDEIEILIDNCNISLHKLENAINLVCENSSINRPLTLDEIEPSISSATVVALSEPIEKDILLNENWDKVPNTTATALITKVKDFQKQSSATHSTFIGSIFEENIESVITKYRELCDKYFIIQFFDNTCIKHPWKENKHHEIVSPDEIEILIDKCKISLNGLENAINLVCESSSISRPLTLEEIETSISALMVMALSYPIDKEILLNQDWNERSNKAKLLIKQVEDFHRQRFALNSRFRENIFDQDIESIVNEYKQLSAKFITSRIFNSRYRYLKNEISSFYKDTVPKKTRFSSSDLYELSACSQSRIKIRNLNGSGRSLFGSHWADEESDPQILNSFAEWVVSFRQYFMEDVFNNQVVDKISSGISKDNVKKSIDDLSRATEYFIEQRNNLANRVGVPEHLLFHTNDGNVSFEDINVQLELWKNGILELQRWKNITTKFYINTSPEKAEEILSDLNELSTCVQSRNEIRDLNKTGLSFFGSHWKDEESDPQILNSFVEWVVSFRQQFLEDAFNNQVVDKISSGISKDNVKKSIDDFSRSTEHFIEQRNNLANRVGVPEHLLFHTNDGDVSFEDINVQLELWKNGILELQRWKNITTKFYSNTSPEKAEVILSDLNELFACVQSRNEIRDLNKTGQSLFGLHWKDEVSDLQTLQYFVEWMMSFRQHLFNKSFDDQIFDKISSGVSKRDLEKAIESVAKMLDLFVEQRDKLFTRLSLDYELVFGTSLEDICIEDMDCQLQLWKEAIPKLQQWGQFTDCRDQCLDTFAAPIVNLVDLDLIESDAIIPCLEGNFADNLLRCAFMKKQPLKCFMGELHEKKIKTFAKLDHELIIKNRQRLVHLLYEKQPQILRGASPNSEVGILLGEFSRKRRHMPIRKLMNNAGGLIQKIKPCFMMSPLSIAQFLDPFNIYFDVVVFDEASQVRPEDALGALLRANQCVIIGDTRQLPPTSFFDNIVDSIDDSDEDISTSLSDIESILHLCKRSFLTKNLRWHYRSRHESLIAVSNQEFYDKRLVIYPSPMADLEHLGLKFVHLPDSIYDRGKTSVNRDEAKKVAKAALEHFTKYPDKSLGIGTFNVRQQQAIFEEVEMLLMEHPDMTEFFENKHPDHFFVKNLETIQGDERDVIFISVGFGFDKDHNLSLNFGPLNREGGERRLNVLITRAREKCVVFSNFQAKDLATTQTSPFGVKALKIFMDFAENRNLHSINSAEEDSNSSFEKSIYDFLLDCGYDVEKQVGCAGYRLDMAILDPRSPGRYILGIECDGEKYHSSQVARDRDRLRQQILENLGWTIHRIWSTDWYRNKNDCRMKLRKAIEKAKRKNTTHPITKRKPLEKSVQTIHSGVERKETNNSCISKEESFIDIVPEYRICTTINIDTQTPIHELSPTDLERAIIQILKIESPMHIDEMIKRIRENHGLKRTSPKIKSSILNAINYSTNKKKIIKRGEFLWMDINDVKVRRRGGKVAAKIVMICNEEIAEAVKLVLKSQHATSPDELVVQASRLFGIRSTNTAIAERVEGVINGMISKKELCNLPTGVVDLVD